MPVCAAVLSLPVERSSPGAAGLSDGFTFASTFGACDGIALTSGFAVGALLADGLPPGFGMADGDALTPGLTVGMLLAAGLPVGVGTADGLTVGAGAWCRRKFGGRRKFIPHTGISIRIPDYRYFLPIYLFTYSCVFLWKTAAACFGPSVN